MFLSVSHRENQCHNVFLLSTGLLYLIMCLSMERCKSRVHKRLAIFVERSGQRDLNSLCGLVYLPWRGSTPSLVQTEWQFLSAQNKLTCRQTNKQELSHTQEQNYRESVNNDSFKLTYTWHSLDMYPSSGWLEVEPELSVVEPVVVVVQRPGLSWPTHPLSPTWASYHDTSPLCQSGIPPSLQHTSTVILTYIYCFNFFIFLVYIYLYVYYRFLHKLKVFVFIRSKITTDRDENFTYFNDCSSLPCLSNENCYSLRENNFFIYRNNQHNDTDV